MALLGGTNLLNRGGCGTEGDFILQQKKSEKRMCRRMERLNEKENFESSRDIFDMENFITGIR